MVVILFKPEASNVANRQQRKHFIIPLLPRTKLPSYNTEILHIRNYLSINSVSFLQEKKKINHINSSTLDLQSTAGGLRRGLLRWQVAWLCNLTGPWRKLPVFHDCSLVLLPCMDSWVPKWSESSGLACEGSEVISGDPQLSRRWKASQSGNSTPSHCPQLETLYTHVTHKHIN